MGFEGIHIECKRVEKLNLDEAMEQALDDVETGVVSCDSVPVVFHRRNKKMWKVTMYLDDWIEMYKKIHNA